MACSLSVWRQWVAHTKLRDALQLYEFQFMKYKCGDGSNNDANTKENSRWLFGWVMPAGYCSNTPRTWRGRPSMSAYDMLPLRNDELPMIHSMRLPSVWCSDTLYAFYFRLNVRENIGGYTRLTTARTKRQKSCNSGCRFIVCAFFLSLLTVEIETLGRINARTRTPYIQRRQTEWNEIIFHIPSNVTWKCARREHHTKERMTRKKKQATWLAYTLMIWSEPPTPRSTPPPSLSFSCSLWICIQVTLAKHIY